MNQNDPHRNRAWHRAHLDASIPEVGQLVRVRQRRFVVTDIARSSLPRDALLANDGPP